MCDLSIPSYVMELSYFVIVTHPVKVSVRAVMITQYVYIKGVKLFLVLG